MFNKNKVILSLLGEVGWSQPFDPSLPVIDASNLTARSGYRFDENHFVKIKFIQETQDYHAASVSQFNSLLKTTQETAIGNVLNSVFDGSDLIDRQVLYANSNNKTDVETLPVGFVGFKIDVANIDNIGFELTRCLLEFKGTGDVKLLLFNSSKSTPIQTKLVSITSEFQEVQLNWRVDNSDQYYKGDFYFGYISNGLTISPIERNYNGSNERTEIDNIEFVPMQVTGHVSEVLFDFEKVENVANCWGLNPDITVFNDFTDLICQNKSLFAKAIQMQGQIDVINSYLASYQINGTKRMTDEMINKLIIEIEGLDSDIKIRGLKSRIYGEITRIKKEIQRLKSNYYVSGFSVISRR